MAHELDNRQRSTRSAAGFAVEAAQSLTSAAGVTTRAEEPCGASVAAADGEEPGARTRIPRRTRALGARVPQAAAAAPAVLWRAVYTRLSRRLWLAPRTSGLKGSGGQPPPRPSSFAAAAHCAALRRDTCSPAGGSGWRLSCCWPWASQNRGLRWHTCTQPGAPQVAGSPSAWGLARMSPRPCLRQHLNRSPRALTPQPSHTLRPPATGGGGPHRTRAAPCHATSAPSHPLLHRPRQLVPRRRRPPHTPPFSRRPFAASLRCRPLSTWARPACPSRGPCRTPRPTCSTCRGSRSARDRCS